MPQDKLSVSLYASFILTCCISGWGILSFANESVVTGGSFFLLSPDSVDHSEKGHLDASYRVDLSPDRECVGCSNSQILRGPQIEQSVGGRYGLTSDVSLLAQALWSSAPPIGPGVFGEFGASVEVSWLPISPSSLGGWTLILGSGYRQSAGLDHGLARLELNHRLGNDWTFSAQTLVNHTFASGHDDADFAVGLGLSYELNKHWEAGLEYSGEDLEAIWNPDEAEGGARNMLGINLSWVPADFPSARLMVGPALLFQSRISPQGIGRLAFVVAL